MCAGENLTFITFVGHVAMFSEESWEEMTNKLEERERTPGHMEGVMSWNPGERVGEEKGFHLPTC